MGNRATTASGVKVAQHPQGLTLTPAQGVGARCGWEEQGALQFIKSVVACQQCAEEAGLIRAVNNAC
jgi:hypothetical protein